MKHIQRSFVSVLAILLSTVLFNACQKDDFLPKKPNPPELQGVSDDPVEDENIAICTTVTEQEAPKDGLEKGVATRSSLWRIGQTIRVRFMNGSPDVHAKVEEYARVWESYANIRFVFVNSGRAEIRVAFDKKDKFQSKVGTDALSVSASQPTMYLGFSGVNDHRIKRATLHEFGHALGLKHEHQNPENGIQWNKEAVYEYFSNPPNNWSRETVDHNIFKKLSVSHTHFCMYDNLSIMHYTILKSWTLNNYSVETNYNLSDEDKAYIGRLYPFSGPRIDRKCGEGLAGYDFLSPKDKVLSFDFNNDRREDLFFYRPGAGAVWVVRSNGNGSFTPVYHSLRGIAGYDFLNPNDQVLVLDYNRDGLDDLFFYRPGHGAAWVARSNGDGNFTPVYHSLNGIAGYDFRSPHDRALVFDYNRDGRDDLFFYRPGSGAAWVARSNGNGSFNPVYHSLGGIAGYDFRSLQDRALAFDYNRDGRDDLFFYRPGSGAAWVARSNGNGSFTPVYHSMGGIAGYDFRNLKDQVLVLDYNSDGRDDLFFYRPGHGAAWVARSNGNGSFTPVYHSLGGIAGYDFLSPYDRALVLDYNSDGRDDLLFYRPSKGWAYIARSNGNGTFIKVYGKKGIAGFSLLDWQDRAVVFDYNRDGRDDLFFYRPGRGIAWVVRSNGNGSFEKAN